jgi:hypothetical protein
MVINNSITYGLGKGFSAASGLQWHYKLGLVPTVGFQFLKASPDYLIVIFPTYNFKPGPAIETVALAEYKPKLSVSYVYIRVYKVYLFAILNVEFMHVVALRYARASCLINIRLA